MCGNRCRSQRWNRQCANSYSLRQGCWTGESDRSEEHTSELQSHSDLVCRLLLEKKKNEGGPESIGLKGDTSENIPGNAGLGVKTARQLVAQYGPLEGDREHVDEVAPARAENLPA